MKELRRRGISSDGKGSTGTETRTKSDDDNVGGPGSSERGWSQQGGSKTKSSSQWTAAETDDQLKRSRALNSEGLEVRRIQWAFLHVQFQCPVFMHNPSIMANFSSAT